jgi:hypothetical protein
MSLMAAKNFVLTFINTRSCYGDSNNILHGY